MATYDVIVVGLGGMGGSAAYHLAARGRRVLGLEKFEPVHRRGSSHGGSRIIRQAYFEDPAYVPLLRRAYELWEKLEHDVGQDIMSLTGGLFVGPADSLTFAGSLRAAREWDLPHEILDADELRRRFPTFSPRPDEVAFFEAKAGFVRPEATVAAHHRLAARHGADLRYEEPVLRWVALPGGGVRVTTPRGSYSADRLVLCPGAWAPRLLSDLGLPITVERQVMHWFQPRDGVAAFEPGRHPIYIHEDGGGTQIYGFPAIDGPEGGAKVAFFRRGRPCDPETVDRQVHPEEIQDMRDHLATVLPTLAGRFLTAATCMYTLTPDHHFVIGPHPEHPQVSVACGFSGHGFKFVPVVGEILADLATTGTTAHPVRLFDPRREYR
ncbi:sarcosine oxidase, monomeric form [Micromonospora pallida]|uniref:Sarcosine oxidase, monomeric form n=1 Tax=Micromonospora pallida TaxID=145854 RepID=A0A1C6SD35_9ACTN|nr:N-methyl-L-tryptophan oxidase [Micromonospora pallida]SCL27288.1 sarcosine oxidase, monomeric form [Micromonospora pallida]